MKRYQAIGSGPMPMSQRVEDRAGGITACTRKGALRRGRRFARRMMLGELTWRVERCD